MENILSNSVFFDELASEYDQMITFEKAVENKKKLFKNFIQPGMKYAADLGCGSGVDSIALALNRLKVTAFDPSNEMLKEVQKNTDKFNVKVDFHNFAADSIPDSFNEKFDLVVSLGNTFANIPRENFDSSLNKCFDILKPDGQLIIQVLNYEKILIEKKRIVNITEGVNKYFIRFYDFADNEIIFNILVFNKEQPAEQKLISTKLFPHTQNEFNNALKKLEFNKVEYFTDLEFTIFNKELSKDLIIRTIKD
ncbi:MAG: class I SAM-dependent methyltransferase [Ignavibacteriaceae bacterium]|nr:class I SAM-dependent methyltransferase [Ignavibacteriaceae bacterium]